MRLILAIPRPKRLALFLLALALLVSAGLAWSSLRGGQKAVGQLISRQEQAISTAMEMATMFGLRDTKEVTARQITYGDFLRLSGDSGTVGLSAETPMWLVAISGTVVITEGPPNADGSPFRREFDNMHVLLDSESGRVVQIGARVPGKEIR